MFPKHTRVYVLLLLWDGENPALRILTEVHELGIVLASIYDFEVEIYRTPNNGSHKKLNRKILDFIELGDDNKEDLKFPCWTSRSNHRAPTRNMVKWGGIQNSLKEAQPDVLLLLNCCSSGTANIGVGHETTEFIAACGFNNLASGVGPDSCTYALTIELRLLSLYPKFTAAMLSNGIPCRIQN
ncbi:uncharacterized protein EAE97_006340 [Botrytis byssoidea]|uniref:Uncharacterized protein n=1 Tax=Botrytis byssoidea TaxID=139641 RepID=A0A9P5IRX1_9HELO|nr:uncharacterized protein EAE97_006340 [Botrytis byssoidea]KAF7942886.1 hypothetical protein EAE97_006340 [Botrytis byssoidea]